MRQQGSASTRLLHKVACLAMQEQVDVVPDCQGAQCTWQGVPECCTAVGSSRADMRQAEQLKFSAD